MNPGTKDFDPEMFCQHRPNLRRFFELEALPSESGVHSLQVQAHNPKLQAQVETEIDRNSVEEHSYFTQQELLKQASPHADPLCANFRHDIITQTMEKFQIRGLTYRQLMAFARKVPTVYPWNNEYDRLRQNVNRRYVVFPWLIVMAELTRHVQTAIKWAVRYRIPLCTRSGSHCFEPYSLIDGMIIDQSQRQCAKVSLKKHEATIEAGVLLGPLALGLQQATEKAGVNNLVAVSGTCPNNGFSGFTLGGGIGFVLRQYGVGSDNVLGFEVVLADGRLITANSEEHSDLYWALRGAGNGNFGIVTSYRIKLYEIETVTIFDLNYPLDQLAEVGDAWQHWAPFTDNRLSSELSIFNRAVKIDGQFNGPKHELETLLRPITGHYTPNTMRIEETSYVEAARRFAGKGYWLPFFKDKSDFVTEFLPPQAFEIIRKHISNGGPTDRLECGAFGGQANIPDPKSTAFVHRNSLFWLHYQCHWNSENETASRVEWVRSFYAAMRPFVSGMAYQNIVDSDLQHPLEAYYGENLPRLIEIKTIYDPTNVFKYQQSIPPTDQRKS